MKIDRQELKNISYKLSIIFIAIGIIILSQSYIRGYKGDFSYPLFWIGMLFAIIPTVITILIKNNEDNGDNDIKILILLFFFGFFFYLPLIYWSPTYFRFIDEILHYNSLGMILDKGNLDIKPMFEVSKYYPGLELLAIFFIKSTGLSIFAGSKILIGIIHSMILVFLYMTFKTVTKSQKTAMLGSIIYVGSTGFVFFDALFSYETIGIFLIIVSIFILYKHRFNKENEISSEEEIPPGEDESEDGE